MTPSSLSPCPVRKVEPNEEMIISHCIKCGNEIRLAVNGLTREKVEEAVSFFDHNIGECPGGYHVEMGGWRRMWDLDRAIAEHFNERKTA